MLRRIFVGSALFGALLALTPWLSAQIPPEPAAWIVTMQFHVGATTTVKISRLGSRVLVDHPADVSGATRTLYDLAAKQSLSWNPANASVPCVRGASTARAWIDPFDGARDLAMNNVARVGSETVLGTSAVILESPQKGGSHFRLWVDPRTGLMLKSQLISSTLGALPYFEVTEFQLGPPPASTFATPAWCSSAAKPPQP
jgi:hypothetical protein